MKQNRSSRVSPLPLHLRRQAPRVALQLQRARLSPAILMVNLPHDRCAQEEDKRIIELRSE